MRSRIWNHLSPLLGSYPLREEPLYAAPPLLQRMVDAGRLGRKTGSGFYTYD